MSLQAIRCIPFSACTITSDTLWWVEREIIFASNNSICLLFSWKKGFLSLLARTITTYLLVSWGGGGEIRLFFQYHPSNILEERKIKVLASINIPKTISIEN